MNVAALGLLLLLSTSVLAIEIKPNADGGATITLSKEEVQACKEQGSCALVSKKQFDNAVAYICNGKEVSYKGVKKWQQ